MRRRTIGLRKRVTPSSFFRTYFRYFYDARSFDPLTLRDVRDYVSGNTYRRFEDVVGRIDSWQNPCQSVKIRSNLDTKSCKSYSPFGDLIAELDWTVHDSVVPFAAIQAACPAPSPAVVAEATLWARERSIAAVDQKADLLAFLGESFSVIEDFVGKAGKFLTLITQIQAKCIALYAKYRRSRPDLNDLACWNLAWQFGVEPSLRDLLAFLQVPRKASKRLAWLQKRGNTPTYIKSRRQLQVDSVEPLLVVDEFPRELSIAPGGIQIGFRIVVHRTETVFATTQCVRYAIPPEFLEGVPGFGITMLDMLGLYNPVATAWELTRFSWLIDWFVGYRHRLQMRYLSFSPLKDAEVLASVSSIREVHYGSVEYVDGFKKVGLGGPPVGDDPPSPLITVPNTKKIGSFVMVRYTRIPGDFPVDAAPHLNFSPTWNKAGILLSLAIQGFFKRPRR